MISSRRQPEAESGALLELHSNDTHHLSSINFPSLTSSSIRLLPPYTSFCPTILAFSTPDSHLLPEHLHQLLHSSSHFSICGPQLIIFSRYDPTRNIHYYSLQSMLQVHRDVLIAIAFSSLDETSPYGANNLIASAVVASQISRPPFCFIPLCAHDRTTNGCLIEKFGFCSNGA